MVFICKISFLILVLLLGVSPIFGQTVVKTGGPALLSRDVRSILAQPGQQSTILSFIGDPASAGGDHFHVISTEPNAIITLILPNGMEVNSANAASMGYSYEVLPADSSEPDSLIPTPMLNPGTQTLIGLPANAQSGAYQIKVNTVSVANRALIVATYYSSSSVTTAIITDKNTYKSNEAIVISALVFNGDIPITNATVTAEMRDSAIPPISSQQITLTDSGQYDAATGDGIYTGIVTPATPGTYVVALRVTGVSSSNGNFSRFASTSIRVIPSAASFVAFSDMGIDDNGNGRIDKIEIAATVNVQTAGRYLFNVSLEGANGQSIRGSTDVTIGLGQQQVKVSFDANSIIDMKTGQPKLGTFGPFAIKYADLMFAGSLDAFRADNRDNAGNTGVYSFERNPIIFSGSNTVTAVDTNSNGKFDLLRVQVPVDVLTTGNYVWQAYLTDPTGAEVAFFSLADSQPALLVSGSNTISFTLNGQHINRSQRNGPYSVRAVIYAKSGGATGSTSIDNLVTTSAYSYTQFEPPILLECRNYQYTLPAGQSSVIANYSLPQVRGALYPVTTTCTPPPGSSFAAGTTTVNCTTTESISNLATSCSFNLSVISSADTTPPTITCPSSVYATIPYGQGSGPVTYPAPVVTDDRGGATYTCTPASGSNFFRGTTTVSCTARDTSNNQASCSFNVTVFDVSLQDNQMKHSLWFDSVTGDYYFFSCDGSGYTLSGRGTITRVGCEIRLGNDARVSATFVACSATPSVRFGNAVIKPNPIGGWFYITDGNSLDNLRQCPLQ